MQINLCIQYSRFPDYCMLNFQNTRFRDNNEIAQDVVIEQNAIIRLPLNEFKTLGNKLEIKKIKKHRYMKNESHGSKSHATKHMPKLLTGSTTDMYPVVMDNGKTIIYISDRSRENEIRQKYMLQRQQVNTK